LGRVLIALSAAGCSGSTPLFDKEAYSDLFSKKIDLFSKPTWARAERSKNINLGPSGPVAPEDLVSAEGHCAPAVEPAQPSQAAAPQAKPTAAAPVSDRLEPAMPGAAPTPMVSGGIALGMTECEVVRRAGAPNNVAISADAKGERKVDISYLDGYRPGIYHFVSGRLKVVEQAPSAKSPTQRRNAKRKPAKTAGGYERVYVQ
jgi:hypothetical protein